MSSEENYVDVAKKRLMYEHQQLDDIGQMLSHSETNTRLNQELVQLSTILYYQRLAFKRNWSKLLNELDLILQQYYLNLEGYSRIQAIDMARAQQGVIPPQQQPETKKKGLLGLFK